MFSFANKGTIKIATGSSSGNYIKIGKTIENECSDNSIEIKALKSKGSLDNYEKLISKKVSLGIIQSDVYDYLKNKLKDEDTNKIKLVYPLYDEELHVLIKKDSKITSLADLENKKVVVGTIKSGTWVTSKNIMSDLDLTLKMVTEKPMKSLDKLKNDEVSAIFYVAGAPIDMITNLEKDDGITLLDISKDLKGSAYTLSTISVDTYPSFLDKNITTASITALLVNNKNSKNIGGIYRCIKNKIKKKFKIDEDNRDTTDVLWNDVSLNKKIKDIDYFNFNKKGKK